MDKIITKEAFLKWTGTVKLRAGWVISCLIILLSSSVFGQVGTVQIGSGTATISGSSALPVTNYDYTYSQQIVTAAEISSGGGAAGVINKIRYYATSIGTLSVWDEWSVYLANTTKTSFTSNTDWVAFSDLTEVYEGTITAVSDEWFEITFPTPFEYTGDNLIVAVHEKKLGWTSAPTFRSYSATSNSAIMFRADGNNPDPESPPSATGRYSDVAQLQFEMTLASCFPTNSIQVSEITPYQADITWAASETPAISYDYEVRSSGEPGTPGAAIEGNTTETSITLPADLDPATTYYVYIKSICGDEDESSWSLPQSFLTLCAPLTPPTATQTFDGYTGAAPATLPCWSEATGNFTNGLTGTTSSWMNQNWNNNYDATGGTNGTAAYINLYGADSEWLISPQIDLGDGSTNYQLEYDVSITPWTGTTLVTNMAEKFVKVVVSTDGGDTWEEANVIKTYDNTDIPNNQGRHEVLTLSGYTGVVKFAFYAHSTSTSVDTKFYIDNFKVDVELCQVASNINITDIQTDSVTLTWETDALSTTVEYGPFGFEVGDGTQVSTTEETITIDLEPNTLYQFYLKTTCEEGDSVWIGPVTAQTLCAAFDIPFWEGFNSDSTTKSCWTVIDANNDGDAWDMNYTSNPFEGNQVAILWTDGNAGNNDDWLISPTLNLSSTTPPKRLKYHYRVQSSGEPNDFRVMLSTTGTDPESFTEVIVPLASYDNTEYIEHIVNLIDTEGNPYTGNVNIAFHVPPGGLDGWRLYIDNVIIEDMPPCPDVTGLTFESATENTVTVSWNPGFNETEWIAFVQPAGDPEPTDTTVGTNTTENPHTFTELNPNTEYDVYIRSFCNDEEIGFWIGPVKVKTTQIPAQLDYMEDFEGEIEWSFTNGTQTNQWVVGTAASNGGTQGLYISNDQGVSNAYSDVTTTTHAMRDFAVPANANEVSIGFDWRSVGQSASWGDSDYLRVWLVPSTFEPVSGTLITEGDGRTSLGTFTLESEWQSYFEIFDFTQYAGQNMRIVFEWRNDAWTNGPTPAAIDNVNIIAITCSRPVDVSITKNNQGNMIISWTPVNEENQWEVIILPADQPAPDDTTEGTTVGPNSFYVYTEAEEGIIYNVYVRAICTEEDKSHWTEGEEFSDFNPPACADIDVELPDLNVDELGNFYYCQEDGEVTINLAAQFDAESFKATTSYTVESIPFEPPFPTTGGTPMNIAVDDIFSPSIDLPFDFCFYGQNFSSAQVSSNGAIHLGGNYTVGAPWNMESVSSFPSQAYLATYSSFKNVIMGVYQDINPSITTAGATPDINYQVLGTYPCRALVVSYNDVSLHNVFNGCATNYPGQTYQIVMYEITNIIEVYVYNRESCSLFNQGKGVIGLINEDHTAGTFPPDRNIGTWNAVEEAWRFTPDGETSVEFGWYANGELISTDPDHTITIDESTNFEAIVSYPGCGAEPLELKRSFQVYVSEAIVANQPENIPICSDDELADLTTTIPEILSNIQNNTHLITTHFYDTAENAENDVNRISNPESYIPGVLPKTIYVRIEHEETECHDVTSFEVVRELPATLINPVDLEICVENNIIPAADLTIYEQELLNQLENANGAVLQYYENEEDAINLENPITNPDNYTAGQLPQEIFVRITNIPGACDSIANFSVVRKDQPPLNAPDDVIVCVYYGTIPVVDLSIVNNELVTQYPDPSAIYLEFYRTFDNAEAGINAITNLQSFQPTQLPTTIFVKLKGDLDGCDAIVSFDIVEGDKNPEHEITDLTICNFYVLPELPEGYFYSTQDLGEGEILPAQEILGIGKRTLYVNSISSVGCVSSIMYEVNVVECNVQKGISPNGDGLNDYLDLSLYFPLKIQIFNRHGKEVFTHGPGYTNQWHGQDKSGNPLPEGTYFYRVVTETEELTGYIYLSREIK